MAKKKNASAADDLIKSLLDDVNGDDELPKDGLFLPPEEAKVTSSLQFPVGLDPKNPKPQDTHATDPRPNISDTKTVPLPSPYHSDYESKKPAETAKSGSNFRTNLSSVPSSTKSAARRVALGTSSSREAAPSVTNLDAALVQAENLRIAQHRILQLEDEVDRFRQEHEEIASAADVVRNRADELQSRVQQLEREREEVRDNADGEVMVVKGQLQFKESELSKAMQKIEELEIRLKNDFRKIRVRERELENRLELLRAEKATLIRAKDDSILDLKRKVDQLQHEIDNYREKCLELNKTLESHKEQFKRTVRALKLALTNLEVKDDDMIPLKKVD